MGRQPQLYFNKCSIFEILRRGMQAASERAANGCCTSERFCRALNDRGVSWALAYPTGRRVCPANVAMILAVPGHGLSHWHHIPEASRLAQEGTSREAMESGSWRGGTKRRLHRMICTPVRPRQRWLPGASATSQTGTDTGRSLVRGRVSITLKWSLQATVLATETTSPQFARHASTL